MIVKLKEIAEIAENTFQVKLKTKSKIKFKPGQWIQIIVQDPENKSNLIKRAFSIASSPLQEDISICFRIAENSSLLKQKLIKSPLETEFEIEGPYGNFVLPKTKKDIILIAGGIGIAPFISMIRTLSLKKERNKITLMLTDKNQARTPYLQELRNLEKTNKNFILKYQTKRWSKQQIQEIPEIKEKLFAICGSTEMVKEIQQNLLKINVSENNILTEKFGGD